MPNEEIERRIELTIGRKIVERDKLQFELAKANAELEGLYEARAIVAAEIAKEKLPPPPAEQKEHGKALEEKIAASK